MFHNIQYYGTVYGRVEDYWVKFDGADGFGSSGFHSVKINTGTALQTSHS